MTQSCSEITYDHPRSPKKNGQTAYASSSTRRGGSLRRVVVRGRLVGRAGAAHGKRGRVRIVLERRQAGRWLKVARRSVRARAGGRFSTTFDGMRAARYRVRLRPVGKSRLRVVLESGMPRLMRI